jgi:hypothetical protein
MHEGCRLGKLLVLGALLGCLRPAATLAAALSHKSPFLPLPSSSGGLGAQEGSGAVASARAALAAKGEQTSGRACA